MAYSKNEPGWELRGHPGRTGSLTGASFRNTPRETFNSVPEKPSVKPVDKLALVLWLVISTLAALSLVILALIVVEVVKEKKYQGIQRELQRELKFERAADPET